VSQMTVTKEVIDDPKAFAKFQASQDQLSSALSRLLVVSENYPQLKSNENFMNLQTQLEGTENRITVNARGSTRRSSSIIRPSDGSPHR